MSAKQSKNGVLTLIIWNLIIPIRVVTLVNPINKVNLMLNYTLTIPYIVVLSYTLVLSLLNAKNWPYPTVDRLDAPILIIMPIKLFAV